MKKFTLAILVILISGFSVVATATEYLVFPSDSLWSQPQEIRNERFQPGILHLPYRDFENYLGQFQRTVAFLDRMQEHDPESDDFGGMHEGEDERWNIVETDNTQESIRVWCEYIELFDDRELVVENIEDAWIYCANFPAWEEANGNEDALYYSIHNSGWGLIAEIKYREIFDDSQRDYGLQCADHLVEFTPEIEPDQQDRLMPLAAGWAAGTLYEYGIFEDNEDYRNRALEIAEDVKAWISEDFNRLNANEIWALCGGTAMWGVLNSLGKADSTETADWATEALESMDIFAGVGQWNNSWNIWYAHAWIVAHELTGEAQYQQNATAIVDSLLQQDFDRDGGISPTGGNDEDESWVSAYTAWMGLSNLIEVIPEVDMRMISIQEPDLSRPWPTSEPLSFRFEFEQLGSGEDLTMNLLLNGAVEYEEEVNVNGWQPHEWSPDDWRPGNWGDFEFVAFCDAEDDADRSNDSLIFSVNILPVGAVAISTLNIQEEPIRTKFEFYNQDLDDEEVFYTVYTDSADGGTEFLLMVGNYRIEIEPDYPYARSVIDEFLVTDEQLNRIDLELSHPSILVIDNDTDSTHKEYYTSALEDLNYSYYCWDTQMQGILQSPIGNFNSLIYFTGDRIHETIPDEYRLLIGKNAFAQINLFITGQYISGDVAEDEFLTGVLHSRFLADSMRTFLIEGVDGDPVMDGAEILLLGNQGANNQRGKSAIAPVNGGVVAAFYEDREDSAAAVRWESTDDFGRTAKGIFFSFGFEGISGQIGATREDVMRSILEWFGAPLEINDSREINPEKIELLTLYPNPFNNILKYNINTNGVIPYWVTIYDYMGREINKFQVPVGGQGVWMGVDRFNNRLASGSYLVQVSSGRPTNVLRMQSVVLLK